MPSVNMLTVMIETPMRRKRRRPAKREKKTEKVVSKICWPKPLTKSDKKSIRTAFVYTAERNNCRKELQERREQKLPFW